MSRLLAPGVAFIGLGANLPGELGDPVRTLKAAIADMALLSQYPLQVSSFYESVPKDCPPDSPRYVNAVAALRPLPGENPDTLLARLQAIECRHGRVRSGVRNEARTLDLDLLAFGDISCDTATLTLPHPRAHERRFVLEPWIEIAGEQWELNGRSLLAWLQVCSDPPLQRIAPLTGAGMARHEHDQERR